MIADAKRTMRAELAEELTPMISNVVREEFVGQFSVQAAEAARVVIEQHMRAAVLKVEQSVQKIRDVRSKPCPPHIIALFLWCFWFCF